VNRIPKKAWFTYRDALAPLALSLRSDRTTGFSGESIQVELWLANDLDEAPAGYTLDYEIIQDGKSLASGIFAASPARCAPVPQGIIEIFLPEISDRTNITVAATLLDSQGIPVHDTSLNLEVFPHSKEFFGSVYLVGDSDSGKELLRSLEIKSAATLTDADTILITDFSRYLIYPDEINEAVAQGATAVLMPLPLGTHRIGNYKVKVLPAGMGARHFVSRDTGHPIVENFEPEDFKFWYDEHFGYVTPILDTVLEAKDWEPILLSGDGGWDRPWAPVPVAAERKDGRGCWRICQMSWANRIRTNPAAKLFTQNILTASLDLASTNVALSHSFAGIQQSVTAVLSKHDS